jgi:hypothetical protein
VLLLLLLLLPVVNVQLQPADPIGWGAKVVPPWGLPQLQLHQTIVPLLLLLLLLPFVATCRQLQPAHHRATQ